MRDESVQGASSPPSSTFKLNLLVAMLQLEEGFLRTLQELGNLGHLIEERNNIENVPFKIHAALPVFKISTYFWGTIYWKISEGHQINRSN